MSNFEQEPIIEPPVIEVTIDGNEMILHWFNTTIFEHREEYEYLDHIFISSDEESGIYLWRQNIPNFEEVAERLIEEDFPYIFKPCPTTFDLREYDAMMERVSERADEYLEKWASEYGKEV